MRSINIPPLLFRGEMDDWEIFHFTNLPRDNNVLAQCMECLDDNGTHYNIFTPVTLHLSGRMSPTGDFNGAFGPQVMLRLRDKEAMTLVALAFGHMDQKPLR